MHLFISELKVQVIYSTCSYWNLSLETHTTLFAIYMVPWRKQKLAKQQGYKCSFKMTKITDNPPSLADQLSPSS